MARVIIDFCFEGDGDATEEAEGELVSSLLSPLRGVCGSAIARSRRAAELDTSAWKLGKAECYMLNKAAVS